MNVMKRLHGESSKNYALRVIRAKIGRLEIEPGSAVNEAELGAELGMSRTPVHEAMKQLAQIGIVEIRAQSGTYISQIDYDKVDEASFMRCAMECAVIELLCETATEKDIQVLEESVSLQEYYLERNMPDKIMELDAELHRTFFEIANKKNAYEMVISMAIHFDRVRNMAASTQVDARTVRDHRELINLIAAHDAKSARALMKKHLSQYRVDEQAIREKYPPHYFKQSK